MGEKRENSTFFGNTNKYVNLDDSTIILDDCEMELYDSDEDVILINDEIDNNVSAPSSVKNIIEEKENINNEIIIEPTNVSDEPIVELLSDEELKPATNESLYKMIVETLDDDKRLIPNEKEEDKSIKKGKTKEETETPKSSSVLEVDSLLNSLSNDVSFTSDYITNIIEKKKYLEDLENKLVKERQQFEEEKESFEKYKYDEQKRLDNERVEYANFFETQKENYNASLLELEEIKKSELEKIEFIKQSLDVSKDNLDKEKEQFEEYKKLEDKKIQAEQKKLEKEKTKFEKKMKTHNERMNKEKENIKEFTILKENEYNAKLEQLINEEEKINNMLSEAKQQIDEEKNEVAEYRDEIDNRNALKEQEINFSRSVFETEKEQFNRYKEQEEKRIKFENNELEKGFAKLKKLIEQFNLEFKNAKKDE